MGHAWNPNGRIAASLMRLQLTMRPRPRACLHLSASAFPLGFLRFCRQKSTSSRSTAVPKFSLRQLRDLALLCGRNTSGTKAVLLADLQNTQATAGNKSDGFRILSIDMGVRNLAYCLLHVGPGETIPRLLAWERLSLIGDGLPEVQENSTEAASTPAPCPYSPPAMAAVAARLVHDRLLPLAPSHIVIERQRFRSGGAAAVLEWTVRVNSLEAMLHGIFAARQITENDSGKVSLSSVEAASPRRIAQFVVRGGLAGRLPASVSVPPKATKEKDIKDIKEAIVAAILRPTEKASRLLSYDSDGLVGEMVAAYLARWDVKQKKSRRRPKDASSQSSIQLSKIDDLADCVTQGLVWLEWNQNTKNLREKGAEYLLNSKQLLE